MGGKISPTGAKSGVFALSKDKWTKNGVLYQKHFFCRNFVYGLYTFGRHNSEGLGRSPTIDFSLIRLMMFVTFSAHSRNWSLWLPQVT